MSNSLIAFFSVALFPACLSLVFWLVYLRDLNKESKVLQVFL